MPVGKTPDGFGDWLRAELVGRGYDLLRGGQSGFAREADIDVSIVNRTLKGVRMPEIDALRRIGRALGYSLGEMLVVAGLASRDELPVRPAAGEHATTDAIRELKASAQAEGKTFGELLLERQLADEGDLAIPPALPPDPIIVEIEESDLPEASKERLVRMHLANRARRFEEQRLRKRPND
jgi:hypothetical protein